MPDTESGEGPVKVSMDYMYLHERIGKYIDIQHNPPYLIVVEHKHGRCWAHQVPNKGVNDGAHWVLKRDLMDLENNGMGKSRILLKNGSGICPCVRAKSNTGAETRYCS